ncbi:BBE domain-containing protein [Streptomyces sp. NPDC001584]|uniref:BBE domain-containing protein n=1 Tax=Streptomyces sp. NPDC001584 TaxID=3154521 RepID=UPI00332BB798
MQDPSLYPDLKAVLEELQQALGAERARHDAGAPLPPDPNVSAFAPRDTRAVLRPGSVADVTALVGAFHRAKASGAGLPGPPHGRGHPRGRRSAPRTVVGPHRRRRRQLRPHHPLLVPHPRHRARAPERQLPAPPARLHASAIDLSWSELTEDRFVRLLQNYGAWHERNSGPDAPGRHLSTLFNANARRFGSLAHYAQSSSRATLDRYLAALLDGTGLTPRPVERPSGELAAMPNLFTPRELPWLDAARMVGSPNPVWANPLARVGLKSAYHRRNFTGHQLKAAYRHLSQTDNPDTSLVLLSFGGAINAHGEADTAAAQRDSVFKVLYQAIWSRPQDDERETARLRAFYGDVYAETGGVPVIGGVTDGCYINYPDTDLADPAVNTSGVPWHELFYKGGHERLRAVKRRYDPHAVFRHKLSVAP